MKKYVVRIIIILLSAAMLTAPAGCARGGGEAENDTEETSGAAAKISVSDIMVEAPDVSSELDAELRSALFRYELAYAGGDKTAAESIKSGYIYALNAGFSMSAGEFSELSQALSGNLRMIYLTDKDAQALYDSRYDSYDEDAFTLLLYGVTFGQYVNICYESQLAEKYRETVAAGLIGSLTTEEIADYYSKHEAEYTYAEVYIINAGENAPELKNEADGLLNGAKHFIDASENAAAEASAQAEKLMELFGEDDESGSFVFCLGEKYEGLQGEAAAVATAPGNAAVLEYGDRLYIIITGAVKGFGADELTAEGEGRVVLEALALEKAGAALKNCTISFEYQE